MKKILLMIPMLASAACLADSRPYLKQSQERIAQIAALLPEKPSAPGAHISDREVWDRLAAAPSAAAALKKAEAEMKSAIPDCPDALYLEFSTPGNGNRTHYERPYFRRMQMLQRLVLGECLENKGRFIPKVVELMNTVCAERSWTMPAHDRALRVFNGEEFNVDLGASHRAETCAWALAVLKGKLPEETAAKMRNELERRIFGPVRRCCRAKRREECTPMWWFQGLANWTSVCQSCVTRAALAVVDDRMERAEFVEGAERSVPGFLSGFSSDGYCSEGLGYWNYGWGNFLTLAIAVREATGGKVDFCASEKARTVMRLGTGILVAGCHAAPIADGGGNLDNGVLQLGHLIWPDLPLTEPAAKRNPLSDGFARFTLLDFGQWERVPAAPAVDYPIRTEFPVAQLFVMRPGASDMPFRLSVKAGHNGEFHNHNDVGTYALFVGEREIAGDPGGSEYTAKTFSKHRYEIKVINSYGHPVPVLNGALQMPGAKFAGKVLSTEFTESRDVVTFDLLGAYDPVASKASSLVRTFTYDRAAHSVAVADKVAFAGTGTFSVPVVTAGRLEPCGAEGEYVLFLPGKAKKMAAKVGVRVVGAKWRMECERIDNPNRVSPNRYAIILESPVAAAEVTVTYTKPPTVQP